jgi:peptidyl-prolyl cis-trans isomerase D
MFELIRQHNRAIMFVLVLLVFPSFVFFGIQGYSRMDSADNVVATVDGVDITQAEWDNAFRFQVEQLRQSNPTIDPAQFDTPRVRSQVLEQVIRERVLFTAAVKLNLNPSDERLQRAFATDPQFANLRNPDGTVNRDLLAQQGLSSTAFAERLRQDLALRQVTQPISTTALVPAQAASAALGALFQQREVQMVKFEAKDFQDKATADDAEVRAYYDDAAHAADFMAPEIVDIEYVVLDLAEITRDIKVTDEEIQRYYDDPANASRFTATEQRRARHILVQVAADASADDKAKAKAKADELLALVQKDRASFPEVARKESSDTVSAQNGGDLDYFGRDAMVAPFADAVFSMKKGELSGVVETEYGFHIIELLDVRGGAKQPLDAVRSTILDELRRPQADKLFAEKAAAFSDAIDDQSDSLKPAAEKLGLSLLEAKGVQRTPAQGLQGPLSNPTLLKAVFEPESLASKRNSRAIQLGSGQLGAARVMQHTPARKLPFEAVAGQARAKVIEAKALKAAREAGAARLAEWKAAPEKADFPVAVTLSRISLQGQPRTLVDAVMRAPAEQLPAWSGVDLGAQGYAVVRINKVLAPDASAGGAAATLQYGFAWGAAEEQAYLAALRERYKVSVKAAAAASAATP